MEAFVDRHLSPLNLSLCSFGYFVLKFWFEARFALCLRLLPINPPSADNRFAFTILLLSSKEGKSYTFE